MPCGFPVVFRIEKRKKQTGNRPKSEKKKNANVSKSISAKIHPFRLCQPKSQKRNERVRPICISSFLAAAAIPIALAEIASVTLGVGRFGVIFEQQLQ
jgi:hypothetical protein